MGFVVFTGMRFGASIAIGVAMALASFAPLAVGDTPTVPPVSALRTLPPPRTLPANYGVLVGLSAPLAGISRASAVIRTRMLLRNANGVPLYAFAGTKGRVCFNVWGGGGTCGVIDRSHDALWVVNGGRAVAGVVSDRVHAVEISLGGAFVRVPVRHNAFVLPFRMRPGEGLPQPTVIPVVR